MEYFLIYGRYKFNKRYRIFDIDECFQNDYKEYSELFIKKAIENKKAMMEFDVLNLSDFIKDEIYLFKNNLEDDLTIYMVILNKRFNKKKVLKFIEEKRIDEKFKRYIIDIIKRI